MMLILAACLALAVGDETSVEDLAAATPEEAEAAATPDRSAPPVVIPAEPLQLPVPDVYQLTDAVTVMHVRVPGVRKVELSAWFLRGALDLDGALTHGASGVGELQDVATASMASDELEIYTDLNELSVSSYMDDQDGSVDLSSPRDNLEMAWDVWRDVMLQPSFPKADVKRHVRSETIFLRDEAPNDAGTAASYGSHWAWTPKDHALGYRPNLTELSKLKTDALVERHARWVDSSPIVVFVVGDVAYDDVQPKLAEIFADMGSAGERSDEIALAAPDTRVLAIDTPGNAQVALRLRTTAPPLTHPDRSAAELVNFALGGNFLSRLNRNLREEKGYTYGAGSRYVAGPERAYWQVSTSVAGEFAGAAIQEIEAELDGLCNGGLIDFSGYPRSTLAPPSVSRASTSLPTRPVFG